MKKTSTNPALKEIPNQMTVCNLEVLLMPQGEVLCGGKSLGFFKEFKGFLSEKNV